MSRTTNNELKKEKDQLYNMYMENECHICDVALIFIQFFGRNSI